MSISVQNAMKSLRPSFSVATTRWPAPVVKGIGWNALCRPVVSKVAEISRPHLIHLGALPVRAPTAAPATEDKQCLHEN